MDLDFPEVIFYLQKELPFKIKVSLIICKTRYSTSNYPIKYSKFTNQIKAIASTVL